MVAKPDPYLIDDENPEWTEADFARARPAKEVLPPELYAELTSGNVKVIPDSDRGSEAVTLDVDADVLAAFKAEGEGWRERMAQALAERAAALKVRGA